LGEPRLSSPGWEPEEEDSLAMTTDDLMKSGHTEGDVTTGKICFDLERGWGGLTWAYRTEVDGVYQFHWYLYLSLSSEFVQLPH
jgi:hypothetical protein